MTERHGLSELRARSAVIEKDGEWGEGVDISAYCSKTGLAVVVQIRNQLTYPIGEDGQEIKKARLADVELVYNGKDHFEYSQSC